MRPITTAVTEKNVTGASKNIIPEIATGNLFSAPAILARLVNKNRNKDANLYVVDDVTRRHHAVQ